MSEHGRMIEPTTIRFERRLPGPIGRVWDYVTKPELRARWLADGPMEPRVGGRVALHFEHARLTEIDERVPARYVHLEGTTTIEGRVTRWEPPRVVAWTWESEGEDSELTIELEEEADAVRLVLTHRRLDDPALLTGVAAGWHAHLAILEDELAGRPRRAFWSTHEALEVEYERRLGSA